MVEKKLVDDCLKAIGITSKGEKIEFKVDNDGILLCSNQDLVSLEIPEGVCYVYCWNNLLTELKLPDGLECLNCTNNFLTELIIPYSIEYLYCDRNVKGLDKIYWECEISLV